ncbi:MAG TPA: hypothetical protein VFX42_08675 [Gemmatimonadales bacterium]|nr:hypothetical protein [Gemmatimonadales bacterium]
MTKPPPQLIVSDVNSGAARTPEDTIPQPLATVLASIHRSALGGAVGIVAGLGMFLLTAAELLRRPESRLGLGLLGQLLPGFAVSWAGAFVGFAWLFTLGFCVGWLLAFIHNLAIAVWIFVVRSRHEMALTRDFLDHV